MRKPRIVLLAQTPPPLHGQSVMQQVLVNATWNWCKKIHIRLSYSKEISSVGRFRVSKIFAFISIVFSVWRERVRGRFDVLYYPPAGFSRIPFYRDVVTLLLVRWTAKNIVFHFHSGGFDRLADSLVAVERFFFRLAYGVPDVAIVLLPSLADEVKCINPRRVKVISNGIEDCAMRVSRSPETDKFSILYVGSLQETKGVLALLLALEILHNSKINIVARIIGKFASREFEEIVHSEISKRNLQDVIRLLGEKDGDDKWKEYAGAHVFCFPTYYPLENEPIAVIEAMMFSLPVITTSWRALPDMVEDGVTGLIVPPRDPVLFSNAILRLAANPAERRSMGKASRQRYEKLWGVDEHLRRMEATFAELSM